MTFLDLPRRRVLAGAVLLLAALVLAGRYLTHSGASSPDRSQPAPAHLAAAAPAKLVVHVVGAVRRPGLYRLPHGARVADAVERAGGPTRRADLALVNLAAPLADGTQVVVPRRAPPAAASGSPAGAGGPAGAQAPVHLNTATLEQLDALPGIGPVTAQKILDYRQQNGAFSSFEELDAVDGIGPARLEQLRGLVAP